MTGSLTFKIQGYVDLSWNQAVWPFWVLFSEIVILSLGSLIISLNTCFGRQRIRIQFNESKLKNIYYLLVIPTVWLCYMFIGFGIASFSFTYLFTKRIDNDYSSISVACLLFIMYLILLLVFTVTGFSKIVAFGKKVAGFQENDNDLNNNEAVSQIQINMNNNQDCTAHEDNSTTEQVHRTIPGFLVLI